MARDVEIEITESSPIDCSIYYIVEYKLSTDPNYTVLPPQYTTPLYIYNLGDDLLYNVRVQRYCCDGTLSEYATTNVTTTP